MTLKRQSQTADYSRSGRSWFVSQSGLLPPRFSSLIRLNSTSGSRHSSKPHERCAGRSCWFQQNRHPIFRVPQKWRNCESQNRRRIKRLVLSRGSMTKPISSDTARRQNYLFGIAKNLQHVQSRNISPELSVWEAKLKRSFKGQNSYENRNH